jgi:uncharacterized membrane protein
MLSLLALALAVIAILRVARLERDVRALRDQASRPGALPAETAAPSVLPPLPRQGAPVSVAIPAAPPRPRIDRPPSPPPAAAPQAEGEPETIERRIGERLLLYAGMVVLVLGVAFFLRYAFEREWMSPGVRVLSGLVAGTGLMAAGRRLARLGYAQYGRILSGGGLAMLFLSVYAAHAFYGLIGEAPAFALLALIAGAAALLADRESSLPLALMAVCGGFATPFLVGGGRDAQVLLFSYDAMLIAATMFLAHRRQWPWLNLASFVLTLFTVVAWADAYYTDAKYLRTELFLTLYCAMFVAILRENRRSPHPHAQLVSLVLCLAPVLYHGASLAILHTHGVALPIYLLLAAVALVVASLETGAPLLRLGGWIVVVAPLMAWIDAHEGREWRSSAVVTSIGIWLVFLVTQVRHVLAGRRLGGWDVALLHASGIGAFAAMYGAIDEVGAGRQAAAAAALGLVDAGLWLALRRRTTAALHWLGLAFSLAAIAIAVGFEGRWAAVMWAAEGGVLVWIGVRTDRDPFRIAGLLLFLIATWHWIQGAAQDSPIPITVFFNARALAGLFIVAAMYAAGWLMRGPRAAADARWRLERAILLTGASAVTVLLVSMEITTFWGRQERGVDSELARHLMLSAWWAAYAGVLVAVGMRRRYAPIRYFAMVLFGITLLKVFVVDIQQLAGIYRVVAFLVVGAILLLASFLYQRNRKG